MILHSDDLTEWILSRKDQLVVAWTPQIENLTNWETPFAEALSGELHEAMVMTMRRRGTETQFLKLIARTNTGLEPRSERAIAERFFGVTVKLARAARRKNEYSSCTSIFPLMRACTVNDGRTDPGHLALDGIVLPCGHPFWERWHPPLAMDCRCTVIQVSLKELECGGLEITTPEDLAHREANLSASWPKEFEPLLDFRAPTQMVDWPIIRTNSSRARVRTH